MKQRAKTCASGLLIILLGGGLVALFATARGSAEAAIAHQAAPELRFAAFELWIESGGRELAAWQVEVTDAAARARLVGLEGGSDAAYGDAPFYDPAAMQQHRVIVAAFSLEETLPIGRAHVATLHFALESDRVPELEVLAIAAADSSGAPIPITAVLVVKERR